MSATESDLAAYANNGRNWDQLCQALVWNWCDQFGEAPVTYASALDAYYASGIVSTDVYSAPPGANVFYDIGSFGHVSVHVDNDHEGMASSRVTEFWGINAGETDIGAYLAQTGAYPLGWAWTNGANTFEFVPAGTEPEPPVKEEDDMGDFNTIRDDNGSIYFADIWGDESILDYFDAGVSLEEGIGAVQTLGGAPVQVSARQRDVTLSIVRNRSNAYIDRIADRVIDKLEGRK